MKRVTADSNIYISALMFGGKPLQILEMALEGEIELTISEAILSETLRVLRDKFHRNPVSSLTTTISIRQRGFHYR